MSTGLSPTFQSWPVSLQTVLLRLACQKLERSGG